MGTVSSPVRSWLSIGAVGSAVVAAQAWWGWGISCPFRELTGWLCPLCGGTTAGVHLVRGEWAGAWSANAAAVLVMLGWALGLVTWPLRIHLAQLVPRPSSRQLWRLSAVAAVVWTLIRNLG